MKNFLFSRTGIVVVGFFAIAGYFLWTEHHAHIAQYWPWLLLAACPLMHLFMHHGHGGHGANHRHSTNDRHSHQASVHHQSTSHSSVPETAKPDTDSGKNQQSTEDRNTGAI